MGRAVDEVLASCGTGAAATASSKLKQMMTVDLGSWNRMFRGYECHARVGPSVQHLVVLLQASAYQRTIGRRDKGVRWCLRS